MAKSEQELAQQTAAIHAELEDQMNHEIALMREKHVKSKYLILLLNPIYV